jgi:hypothetical protein
MIQARVFDVNGRLVKQQKTDASGFVQKTSIDISGGGFAPGLYMLETRNGDKKQIFRLIKQ